MDKGKGEWEMRMKGSGYKRDGIFSGERKTGIKRSSTLILYTTINQGLSRLRALTLTLQDNSPTSVDIA